MVTGFLILGLIKKFEGSSFTFAVGTVLPFFFTGSWNKIMGKVIMRHTYHCVISIVDEDRAVFQSLLNHVQVKSQALEL